MRPGPSGGRLGSYYSPEVLAVSKRRLSGAVTKLEKAVQRIINGYAREYDEGAEGFMEDLMHGGCASGLVSELVYYSDTVRWYRRHALEIDALLQELCSDCGAPPAALFGDKWDADDPLARGDYNQNILAWFGFEETARALADRNRIEV